jgi:hypothetical protein
MRINLTSHKKANPTIVSGRSEDSSQALSGTHMLKI